MLVTLGTPGAHANPDVWVKAAMTYRFDDGKITAVTFDWRFAEYFSSRTIYINWPVDTIYRACIYTSRITFTYTFLSYYKTHNLKIFH